MQLLTDELNDLVMDLATTLEPILDEIEPDTAKDIRKYFDDIDTAIEEIDDELYSMNTQLVTAEDDLSDARDDLETAQALPGNWKEWVDMCIDRLPAEASLGDNVKLTEILTKAIEEL